MLKSLYFYAILLIASGVIIYYKSEKPIIYSIPVIQAQKNLQIIGKNFGKSQKKSAIQFIKENELESRTNYMTWTDTLIEMDFREEMSGSKIILEKKLWFGIFRSNEAYIVKSKYTNKQNYDIPVQQESPWPLFRKNRKNTGFSRIKASKNTLQPWKVQTDKGIFSTPVIDKDENIYVGSADHFFYCIDANGQIKWKFKTGEIIDSGAGILENEESKNTEVLLPSGDGYIYKLRVQDSLQNEERIIWRFSAHNAANTHYNNWFEGNIAIGFQGEILAGNTNFNYYKLNSNGNLDWTYTTTSNNWSAAAIGDDAHIYWGSNDNYVRAVSPGGKEIWRKRTLGFIAASAAITSDGTVIIGSFDSYMYAINSFTGELKWKFKTNDHIYASVALDEDENGQTTRILFGSTDGFFYALSTNGELLWKYYVNDAIRSSAAIGLNPENDSLHVAYFGAGNGKLYALNTHNGSLRWEYNCTDFSEELVDRNDLNASVALGKNGIYTAGEHGQVIFVPYDYPLIQNQANNNQNHKDTVFWQFVSGGGTLLEQASPVFSQMPVITLKINVIKNKQYIDACICNKPFFCKKDEPQIEITPHFNFDIEKSADGHYIHIIPHTFVNQGKYSINLKGNYYTGGWNIGNLQIGGDKSGSFDQNLKFEVEKGEKFAFATPKDEISAFELTRITAPIPPMLPSLNQIGFDYMDWGIGIISTKENGEFIAWTAGIKKDINGYTVIDEQTDFLFPMKGKLKENQYFFETNAMELPITGIPIPFNKLIISGSFKNNFRSKNATLYANTDILGIPTFGKYLVLAGLANNIYQEMNVAGSFITRASDSLWLTNKKSNGTQVLKLHYYPNQKQPGNIIIDLNIKQDSLIKSKQNFYAVLIVNENSFEPVYLNYRKATQRISDAKSVLRQISLQIDEETKLDEKIRIILLHNLYPQETWIIESNKEQIINQ